MEPTISRTGFWDGKVVHLLHGYSVPLVKWIAEYLKDEKAKQIYDFGCGTGQYLNRLREAGFEKLTGFEGCPPEHREFDDIRQQDLTVPFTIEAKGNVICLEVAEHIPAEFESIFLDNVIGACDGKFITSWAVRGQGGYGHVNCLDNDEVIAKLTAKGLTYLPDDTASARSVIHPTNIDISAGDLPWFHSTTLVFRTA